MKDCSDSELPVEWALLGPRSADSGLNPAVSRALKLLVAGHPPRALAVLRREGNPGGKDRIEIGFHHAACLTLFQLSKHEQVADLARTGLRACRNVGDPHAELAFNLHLGKALQGLGNATKAFELLDAAYGGACELESPILRIATGIGLATAYSASRRFNLARPLFEAAIGLAEAETLPGLAREGEIHLAWMEHHCGVAQAACRLRTLSEAADRAGEVYLQAMAAGLAAIISPAENRESLPSEGAGQAYRAGFVFPFAGAYFAAAAVLGHGGLAPEAVRTFFRLLGKCEGLYEGRSAIAKALESLEGRGRMTPVDASFVSRWRARYLQDDSAESILKFRQCDFRACEARCCFDGVFLEAGEAVAIRLLVEQNREFFRLLPTEFIIHGEWNGKSGMKTAVRPHRYRSPDFPAHFSHTRCVFAAENGACTLQQFSERFTENPWTYKPSVCRSHPVHEEKGIYSLPSLKGERQAFNLGLGFPGYFSYLPCGQSRRDGEPIRNRVET